jgi:hypothetical protein
MFQSIESAGQIQIIKEGCVSVISAQAMTPLIQSREPRRALVALKGIRRAKG